MEHALLFDFELKQRVTWRQIDIVALARVPAADNQTPRVRLRLDLSDQSSNLVHAISPGIMAAERTPEIAVNRTQIARFTAKAPRVVFISPFSPNVHTLGAQFSFIRIAGKKPEQFFRDPTEWNFLSRNDW